MTKMTTVLVLAAAIVLIAPAAGAQTKQDLAGIERAVLDYVEGIYEMKPELVKRSVHPDLKKFGFARRSSDSEWRVIPMTFEQLVELAASYYKDEGGAPANAPKKVEILDALNQTASAKLTADWGVDYFHLAKYDGKWKIVHVLWQSLD